MKTRRTASGSARSAPRSVRPKPSTDTIWYYLANREYYAERSKEQFTRRKQSRLEELLAGEPRPFKPPKYTIEQVNNRAIALGISYGWCSYLLSVGKVCME